MCWSKGPDQDNLQPEVVNDFLWTMATTMKISQYKNPSMRSPANNGLRLILSNNYDLMYRFFF